MRKSALIVLLLVLMGFVSGCATIYPVGSLYTEVKLPVQAVSEGDVSYTKVGTAESICVLTLVAVGDSSLEQAIRNGGITKVKYVDWSVTNFLGIIGTYQTKVYGD